MNMCGQGELLLFGKGQVFGRMSHMNSGAAISVIVPVYNTSKYLDAAVQSVLAQTFPRWELLLVDDGSTDGSGEICDRYAAQDGRIRAFHTENRGYGCARNLGIEHARGEWVMFLDSDDYLAPCAMELLLDHAEGAEDAKGAKCAKCAKDAEGAKGAKDAEGAEDAKGADLVMALHQTVPRASVKAEGVRGGRFENVGEVGGILTEVYEPYFFLSVAAKLYRRRVLGDGFDVERGQLLSDWLFNFRVLTGCRGICFVPEIVYYYRWGDHVSTSGRFHAEWLYVCKEVYGAAVGLYPEDRRIEDFMARRYADRVGQYIGMIAALTRLSRFHKVILIGAERSEPFYDLPAIGRASCGRKNAEIWKAFMAGDAEGALEAAEERMKA